MRTLWPRSVLKNTSKINLLTIVAFSDTHGEHENVTLPEGDLLVCCGDWTARDSFEELPKFLSWLSDRPHKHKILVPGNHDFCFQSEAYKNMAKECGIHVLVHDEVMIEGLRFFGSSVQPEFMNWAFNYPPEERKRFWSNAPENVDVLVTHCPPKGILDKVKNSHLGCEYLAEYVGKLPKLKAHIFGHIHEGYGREDDGPAFVNCSLLNGNYDFVNKPMVVEVNARVG
ncbi:MAG: metallophosphatase domain-containing protein [Pseudomonadota bacterium]